MIDVLTPETKINYVYEQNILKIFMHKRNVETVRFFSFESFLNTTVNLLVTFEEIGNMKLALIKRTIL